MALPLGKLAILVGAGIVGSVLAKEGRMPNVSDVFSAFKVLKGIRKDESTSSVNKPRNDSLMAQVNSLRQELQILASSRPVTIVTTSGTGTSRYGIVIVVVVVGYGYVWWKGWKLPDLMFATRRSLSDACTSIAKQLENVYSSISATKRHLSSRIDRLDCNLDEFAQLTAETKDTVSDISAEMEAINANVTSVRSAVENLESKIGRIEGKQDTTNIGVLELCAFASSLSNGRTSERSQGHINSLPPSPSNSNGSRQVFRPLYSAVSASGIMESLGDSEVASRTPEGSNGNQVPEDANGNRSSSSGIFGRRISGINASFLTRTHSLTSSVLRQVRSSTQQS
ncbi:uncharacterized protein LOC115672019 isoform X2 [Syzygium oleosum]|uniref:uncharacterized protein LOC115672019 isoform X2 n=1 Tax=Syzygium oleosum TaxID=219896 RepID=UPI0024B98169|nr:uncharacterized protein LOC115672019 isoform X2 [Syzygium oleosum]